jgi:hypothetical protein
MEWLLLAAIVLVTAAFVAHGLRAPGEELPEPPGTARDALEERRRLLAELAEIDAGTTAGNLSAEERRERRRALAPRLRAATEELRASGWLPQSEARALPAAAAGAETARPEIADPGTAAARDSGA